MRATYVLALDLGTTNCKALLLDQDLAIVDKATHEYSVTVPRPGWAEQAPEMWWNAVRETVSCITARIDPAQIVMVGLSGQMHGLVALDAQEEVLRPAILWNDQRSAPQCRAVYEQLGGKDGLLSHTNNPMLPGYTGGKLLWVREHEPELYAQIATVLLPKDYIRYRLSGELATDVSDASGTGLFDVRERRWAAGLLDKLNLPSGWFPAVYESGAVVGEIRDEPAAQLGLRPGTPVIAGGGDAVMQAVGGGAVNSDVVLVVIGTGGNVTVSTPRAIDNHAASLQVFCHVLPEQWVAMGVTLAAGSSLKWLRDTLGSVEMAVARNTGRDPYDVLVEEAAQSVPGAHGVLFLPYLQGERCPHPDENARGSFVGLGLRTTKPDLIRSVMEGVVFSLRDVLEVMRSAGVEPARVNASGGGSTSLLWRQIQADIFGRPVTTLQHSGDAGALGAGIVAGVTAGLWNAEEAVARLQPETEDLPIGENVARYERLFSTYRSLYLALKPAYDELAHA